MESLKFFLLIEALVNLNKHLVLTLEGAALEELCSTRLEFVK